MHLFGTAANRKQIYLNLNNDMILNMPTGNGRTAEAIIQASIHDCAPLLIIAIFVKMLPLLQLIF